MILYDQHLGNGKDAGRLELMDECLAPTVYSPAGVGHSDVVGFCTAVHA